MDSFYTHFDEYEEVSFEENLTNMMVETADRQDRTMMINRSNSILEFSLESEDYHIWSPLIQASRKETSAPLGESHISILSFNQLIPSFSFDSANNTNNSSPNPPHCTVPAETSFKEPLLSETKSRSSIDSMCRSGESGSNLSLLLLAMSILEKNQLISNFHSEILGHYEKMFISNILYIKHGEDIDACIENKQFEEVVNSVLTSRDRIKRRRKDDELRFVYKRVVKKMIASNTPYRQHCGMKMEDHLDPFMKHYFEGSSIKGLEAINTTFASKKKLRKMFGLSSVFKEEFKSSLLSLREEYKEYRSKVYRNMNSYLSDLYSKGKANNRSLYHIYKRIPWTDAEVFEAISLMTDIVKDM